MIMGIDASNIRVGGGVTHLIELLRAANPPAYGFSKIIVWSGSATLGRIEERPWLVKRSEPLLDRSLPFRAWWQRFRLSKLAAEARCNVMLVPGGTFAGSFRPVVTMSRNMLPFEWRELRRYGRSWMTMKMLILRRTQSRSFRRSDGLIFLTTYAHDTVLQVIGTRRGETGIIPHGIDDRFLHKPREQLPIQTYAPDHPFRVLYVSTIDVFKHQWNVADAIGQLRAAGFPVVLDLVGPAYPPALQRLRDRLDKIDPSGEFVRYRGAVPYSGVHERYAEAHLCLFASSCENMPNVLLEGMASGLPIACSNRGPMPEVLGAAGVYFDPESVPDIAKALRELIDSPKLRASLAAASFERAQVYSWRRCGDETLAFLARLARA